MTQLLNGGAEAGPLTALPSAGGAAFGDLGFRRVLLRAHWFPRSHAEVNEGLLG